MNNSIISPKDAQKENELSKTNGSLTKNQSRQILIDGINSDLSGEYQAILMYMHYSAKLTGQYRRDLRSLFQAEVVDERSHAQFLADKIVALGGEPTTLPRPVPRAEHPREMLEQSLTAEREAIAGYIERIHQAQAFGDISLRINLENQILDETRHKEELERILEGWDENNFERSPDKTRWQDDGGQSQQ